MRKLLSSLLLSFVFLLSQQGALLHATSHVSDYQRTGAGMSEPASHVPGDLQCEACLAFAHLAGIAATHVPAPLLESLRFELVPVDAPAFVAADAPTARSRGPPILS